MQLGKDQAVTAAFAQFGLSPWPAPEPNPGRHRITHAIVAEVFADSVLWTGREDWAGLRVRTLLALRGKTLTDLAGAVHKQIADLSNALNGDKGEAPWAAIASWLTCSVKWIHNGLPRTSDESLLPAEINSVGAVILRCDQMRQRYWSEGGKTAREAAMQAGDFAKAAWRTRIAEIAQSPMAVLHDWCENFVAQRQARTSARGWEKEDITARCVQWWHRYYMPCITYLDAHPRTIATEGTVSEKKWNAIIRKPVLDRAAATGASLQKSYADHIEDVVQWPGEVEGERVEMRPRHVDPEVRGQRN